jgi:uncharacterized protein YjbJ (UPF0337 family)
MFCPSRGWQIAPTSFGKETSMNNDILAGKWKQLEGKVREKWGKLTGDDLEIVHGHREQLIGRIQERYGIARAEAERQVDEFLKQQETMTKTAGA